MDGGPRRGDDHVRVQVRARHVLRVARGRRARCRPSALRILSVARSLPCSVAAFAASGRVRRRPGDRRAVEAASALRQSLESAVLLRLYPNSEIEVHVQVLQSDGGALAAAVNAATLALIDAGVAMSDYVVGCGVAYIQRTPLLGARARAWRAAAVRSVRH